MTKQIELTRGQFALVDDDMYEYLNQWKWQAHFSKGKWYAVRKEGKRPFQKLRAEQIEQLSFFVVNELEMIDGIYKS